MPAWKLTVEYDGSRYRGWQSQKNTERTIQGVLRRAARELLARTPPWEEPGERTPACTRWRRSRT